MDFAQLVQLLIDYRVYDILMPFFLVFVFCYASLIRSEMFKEKKNILLAISASIAGIVVIPHVTGNYPAGFDPVEFINQFLPYIALFMVIFFFINLLGSHFGTKGKAFLTSNYSLFSLIAINMIIRHIYPEIGDFFFLISVLMVTWVILFSKGPGITAPFISVALAIIIYLMTKILVEPRGLPSWMTFTLDLKIRVFIVIVFVIIVMMKSLTMEEGQGGLWGKPKQAGEEDSK